ncbi:MAG: type II toxin-antitoxin system HicA family toxin [Planctomycetota bacterium]
MSHERLPVVKPTQLVRVLERMGFVRRKKTKGGHLRYGHPDGRITTVPMHQGQDIGRGLLRKIIKDINLTSEEFKNLL